MVHAEAHPTTIASRRTAIVAGVVRRPALPLGRHLSPRASHVVLGGRQNGVGVPGGWAGEQRSGGHEQLLAVAQRRHTDVLQVGISEHREDNDVHSLPGQQRLKMSEAGGSEAGGDDGVAPGRYAFV